MKKEQRKMNLATYRKCDEIRQEVLTARNGKKVRGNGGTGTCSATIGVG